LSGKSDFCHKVYKRIKVNRKITYRNEKEVKPWVEISIRHRYYGTSSIPLPGQTAT
jgi:hypothetical protein